MAMSQLHPGVKWQFRIGGYFWFGFLGIFLGTGIIAPSCGEYCSPTISVILLSILGYVIFVIVASEIYARMSYNRWFYEFSDDGLKLERGIIWKRYSNVPYERVQNVDIHRRIIARMLGFSSVMIQTAGYSAQPRPEGYIPALDMNRAEQIRSFLMKKITRRRR
jgi:uncharacterized membrane protein YdbT with pleckstrin-like domain